MSNDSKLTLTALCERAGVTPRTVRYYIQQGLLPAPDAAGGPGAHYGEGHVARLRVVRELQREHLPLAEVRKRLASVSDAELLARSSVEADEHVQRRGRTSAADYVRRALGDASATPPPRSPAPSSPPREPAVERSTWERIALTPDIEVHVRRPLSRLHNKLLERLLDHAKSLLEEDST